MIAAILALAAGMFIVAPGGAALFDGLPISGPFEFISAAGLIALAVSPSTRATLAASAAPLRRLLVALLLAGLIVKAAVIARGTYDGFLGCYEGVVSSVGACAVSYDNPFRQHGATRIDARVHFDEKTWRLGLLNTREFDFARDNSPAVMAVGRRRRCHQSPDEGLALRPAGALRREVAVERDDDVAGHTAYSLRRRGQRRPRRRGDDARAALRRSAGDERNRRGRRVASARDAVSLGAAGRRRGADAKESSDVARRARVGALRHQHTGRPLCEADRGRHRRDGVCARARRRARLEVERAFRTIAVPVAIAVLIGGAASACVVARQARRARDRRDLPAVDAAADGNSAFRAHSRNARRRAHRVGGRPCARRRALPGVGRRRPELRPHLRAKSSSVGRCGPAKIHFAANHSFVTTASSNAC